MLRRGLLAFSALFLALSADRLSPDAPPAPPRFTAEVATWPARDAGRFDGPGDPLNLAFVGAPEDVRAALTAAGWTEVPTTIRASVAAGLGELWDGRPLAAFPPMNDYRVAGRRQDMNWALPLRPVVARHHFRLWDTGLRDARGRTLWWGSGNLDLSVRWRDLSHTPDPDMDRERDFVAASLKGSPLLESVALVPAPQVPREGANEKGYAFRDDGRVAVIALSAPGPSRPSSGP